MSTILFAAGAADDRSAIAELLSANESWRVLQASGGKEALEKLDETSVDIFLTDTSLLDMGQEELLTRLRKRHPFLPVVLVTAKGPDEAIVRALRLGAASYVPRSSLARDLVSTVSRVLALCEKVELQCQVLERRTECQVRFEIENDSTVFHPIVAYLQDELENFRICTGNDRVYAGIAIEEALLNGMIHGNLEIGSDVRGRGFKEYDALVEKRRRESPYRERRLRVTGTFTRDRAVITVADDGSGFDEREVPDPLTPENMPKLSGRGLLLMKTFMDEVRYNEAGNEVTLIKKRASSTPGSSS